MKLPGRAFFNVWEAAARWGCSPSDIVEWSTLGHIQLVASLPRVVSDGVTNSGIFEINPFDLMPYFPRLGSSLEKFPIHNVRPVRESDDWNKIDAEHPIHISSLDVLIRSVDAQKFEDENGLSQKIPSGLNAKHDWDGMWQFVCRRVYESGLPETAMELAIECEEWFARRDASKVPDLSTIRKKVSGLVRELVVSEKG